MTATPRIRGGERPILARGKILLGAEVLAAYARVRWLLWRRDLPAAVAALRARQGTPRQWSGDDDPSAYGARLGRRASRTLAFLPTDPRCLVRSLVLIRLLSRRGITSSLVIGVRPGSEFSAHAWVEHDGRPLLEPGGSAFGRLVEIGEEPRATVP